MTSNYPRWSGDTTTPFVHQLCTDLQGLGWEPTVLAPHAQGAATFERLDGIAVHRFRYWAPARAENLCYGGGALINLRESKSAAIKAPALVMAEWLALTRHLLAGADLVHAHWVLPQGFVASVAPRRRTPRVVTVHGGDIFGLRGPILDRFAARALSRADRVTVNSPATEVAARRLAGPRAGMELIPMGADLSRPAKDEVVASVRARFVSTGGPLLLFLGRLVEEKGVEDVVRALPAVLADHPDAVAVLAGTGQHRDRVAKLAADTGVADRVHLPGWVDPDEVPSWFAAADVVLAPSRIGPGGWEEGQGLSVIEAMGVGAVVIATRTGGLPDTIEDGVTGLLVDPAAPESLASAVDRVLSDRSRAAGMGEAARRAVQQRFSREASAARFDRLFGQLTGRDQSLAPS